MSVRQALGVYRSFQAREPDFVTALDERIQFPEKLGAVGRVRELYYRSDKWRSDGWTQLYVHPYESDVQLCEPWRPGLPSVRGPAWPRELVQLGTVAGIKVERDNELVWLHPPDGTLLCATPDGKTLVLLHLRAGVLAALIGGKQRVSDRGVEG